MVEPIERTTLLIAFPPAAAPGLEAALQAMGLDLPRIGRFTLAGGLLLACTAPGQILAMRNGKQAPLMDELAPLAAVAGLIDQSDARVALSLTGPRVEKTLARLLSLDLACFCPGQCMQAIMAHLSVLAIRRTATEIELHCARSFATSFRSHVEAAMESINA